MNTERGLDRGRKGVEPISTLPTTQKEANSKKEKQNLQKQ